MLKQFPPLCSDWRSLQRSLAKLDAGERDYSKLNVTLTGDNRPTEFYVMYEKWKYVADWALLLFAPVSEVDNAIQVRIVENNVIVDDIALKVRRGVRYARGSGDLMIRNDGTLDVTLHPRGIPKWLKFRESVSNAQTLSLRAGETLNLDFDVLTNELDVGTTSTTLLFRIEDDGYSNCFYVQEKALRVTVYASMAYYVYLLIVLFIGVGIASVYAYIERRKKDADSLWEVAPSELIYDEPPEVLGRGTFGLVLR